MARLVQSDKDYIEAGKWKCPTSPTGAHHSSEVSRHRGYGLFVCKYCQYVQNLPLDYQTAIRLGTRNLKDPMIDPKTL